MHTLICHHTDLLKVPSHFYSFSFALNPDWSKLFSMQPEIKSYFQSLATRFDILPNITFNAAVESAVWDQAGLYWRVNAVDQTNKSTYQLTARAVVCAVGSLSIPKSCTIPGAESFSGKLFHSAKWDKSFDWTDRNVVAVGNGCSATQFVPVMTGAVEDETFASGPARQVVQFSRQAHYIIPRTQISYTPSFKWVMRNVPLAMRLYRGLIYVLLEKDFAGFHATRGQKIRDQLAQDNNDYVKSKAPEKYWDYLIPKHQVLCKRKVLDTDYLDCLSRPNMELVPDDPIQHIEPEGIRTKSGRLVPADAIVLATGFEFHRLYFPMRIVGSDGLDLEEHVSRSRSPCHVVNSYTDSNRPVEQIQLRPTSRLPRHPDTELPELLHPNGSQHPHRPLQRHLHLRMPDPPDPRPPRPHLASVRRTESGDRHPRRGREGYNQHPRAAEGLRLVDGMQFLGPAPGERGEHRDVPPLPVALLPQMHVPAEQGFPVHAAGREEEDFDRRVRVGVPPAHVLEYRRDGRDGVGGEEAGRLEGGAGPRDRGGEGTFRLRVCI